MYLHFILKRLSERRKIQRLKNELYLLDIIFFTGGKKLNKILKTLDNYLIHPIKYRENGVWQQAEPRLVSEARKGVF